MDLLDTDANPPIIYDIIRTGTDYRDYWHYRPSPPTGDKLKASELKFNIPIRIDAPTYRPIPLVNIPGDDDTLDSSWHLMEGTATSINMMVMRTKADWLSISTHPIHLPVLLTDDSWEAYTTQIDETCATKLMDLRKMHVADIKKFNEKLAQPPPDNTKALQAKHLKELTSVQKELKEVRTTLQNLETLNSLAAGAADLPPESTSKQTPVPKNTSTGTTKHATAPDLSTLQRELKDAKYDRDRYRRERDRLQGLHTSNDGLIQKLRTQVNNKENYIQTLKKQIQGLRLNGTQSTQFQASTSGTGTTELRPIPPKRPYTDTLSTPYQNENLKRELAEQQDAQERQQRRLDALESRLQKIEPTKYGTLETRISRLEPPHQDNYRPDTFGRDVYYGSPHY